MNHGSIYLVMPKPDDRKAITVIKEELANETRYEESNRFHSFRAELLRKLLKRILG